MIWLTWRQHRFAVSGIGVVFVGIAAVLLVISSQLRAGLDADGLGLCIGINYDCGSHLPQIALIEQFRGTLIPLAPALVGVFLGAPLLAKELEQRTLRYTWTQGISRTYWLSRKVLMLGAVVLLFSSLVSAAFMWYYAPAAPMRGWFDVYSAAFPVFPAMCLFGFALGVLAGTVLRHLLLSMGAALVGFLVVLAPIAGWLRYHYLPTVQMRAADYDSLGNQGTLVDTYFGSASGEVLDMTQACQQAGIPCSATGFNTQQLEQLNQAGFARMVEIQPVDHFWTFQLIETGIFLVLAAACVVATYRLLQRKAV
ncbi:hypothetical protein [Saccharopolyspora sp. 5N708]|uniref:hypothetical protein n=1 Tax=Saccharopolyspora sp. 5N708 TaxID=3457424 RepID=UPI003FD5445D